MLRSNRDHPGAWGFAGSGQTGQIMTAGRGALEAPQSCLAHSQAPGLLVCTVVGSHGYRAGERGSGHRQDEVL